MGNSEGAAGGGAGGPGPLKIEASEVTGDVDDFADEKKSGNFARLHGFAGEFVGVHATGSDFGFFVALGACGSDDPVVNLAFKFFQRLIGPRGRSVEIEPADREPIGENSLQRGTCRRHVANFPISQRGSDIAIWREVDADRFARVPIGRDLQDGGAAQAAVRDQHALAESMRFTCLGISLNQYLSGNTGEVAIFLAIFRRERERDQRGFWRDDCQAELAGEIVPEGSGAHFGDGESAGSHDESGSAVLRGFGARHKFSGALHFADFAVEEDFYASSFAFYFEQVRDFAGGAVAEELAEGFLVVGDAMFFDERDEVRRRVAGQRGFGEVRIGRDEVFRLAMNIREVAAPAAGNKNFLADTVGTFEDSDAPPSFAGFDGAHEAGGARAEDHDVTFVFGFGNGREIVPEIGGKVQERREIIFL